MLEVNPIIRENLRGVVIDAVKGVDEHRGWFEANWRPPVNRYGDRETATATLENYLQQPGIRMAELRDNDEFAGIGMVALDVCVYAPGSWKQTFAGDWLSYFTVPGLDPRAHAGIVRGLARQMSAQLALGFLSERATAVEPGIARLLRPYGKPSLVRVPAKKKDHGLASTTAPLQMLIERRARLL